MQGRKNKMNLSQLAEIDMVSYLDQLGYSPAKIRGQDYWYLSPLRTEKTPSFKINRRLNKWFDHGTGKGGGLVSFALEFHRCTAAELLENFAEKSLPQHPIITAPDQNPERKVIILERKEITSPALITYAALRAIPKEILTRYCLQLSYGIADKKYFAIGFKNDLGGYELRNKFFKTSSSPKAITLIKPGNIPATELLVFEGFFDFLSFLVIHVNHQPAQADFLILNSTAFFKKSLPLMLTYPIVRLFLDHDLTGQNCRQMARKLDVQTGANRFVDESHFYSGYNDLNLWLINAPGHKASNHPP